MNSPAEKYSRFRKRNSHSSSNYDVFLSKQSVYPDDFQFLAFKSISENRSLLVAAPTGSGKTLIAEFGIWHTLQKNKRIFYTTPIKALSNQKFRDFCDIYGEESVGLLTGDRKKNPDAKIVVMTTEILRNMLYGDIDRFGLVSCVVMDEVHYLSDKTRGSVWEESLILLPDNVNVICLSATVSNAEEFGEWLDAIRGNVDVILSEKRPIPLKQLVFFKGKNHELFINDKASGKSIVNPVVNSAKDIPIHKNRTNRFSALSKFDRNEIIRQLEKENTLPCIYFIFSRKGCDSAAAEFVSENAPLINKLDASKIDKILTNRLSHLAPDDMIALDFDNFRNLLQHGVATHHAGMIPLFKELIEELFQANLIKVVFATETLALGINMPARTVVIESLRKFDGISHVDLTAGEFTQLTGRAGRRGLDTEGYAIVPITESTSAATIASLASTRTYPLRSSFRPNYNMSLNLVNRFGKSKGIYYLEKSFVQYQAEQNLRHAIQRIHEIKNLENRIKDEFPEGDLEVALDYFEKHEEINRIRNMELINRFNSGKIGSDDLKQGSVFYFPKNPGKIYIATDVNFRKRTISAIVAEEGFVKFNWSSFESWPIVYDSIKIPKGFNPNDRIGRSNLLSNTSGPKSFHKNAKSPQTELNELQKELEIHEFHHIGDRLKLEKSAKKTLQLQKERTKLENKVSSKSNILSRSFTSICEILENLAYLKPTGELTAKGFILSSIYAESDLLLAETIHDKLLDNLELAELGSILSCFIYESRFHQSIYQVSVPTKKIRERLIRIDTIFEDLRKFEESKNVSLVKPIDAGFANAIYDWVNGVSISDILIESDLSPGDFVRWIKQIMDLANQLIATDLEYEFRSLCIDLRDKLDYGIVSASDQDLLNVENVDEF